VTAVNVVVALLMVAGVIGAVVPFVPGTPLIFAGAVVYAVATDFTPVGAGRLALLAVVAALGWTAEHAAGILGARRGGGSRAAVIGALLGTVVGLAFAPLGLLVGPIAGAILAELLVRRDPAGSLRAGVGTAIGVVVGVVAHLAFALAMVALFAWWVWHR
jgi:uncharacterized protein YqgC (DUF456 family)